MSTTKIQGSTRLLPIVGMLALAWSTSVRPAAADGLFFQLPADGTSVIYDMEVTSDGERREGGTVRLTLAKVGKGDTSKLPDSN